MHLGNWLTASLALVGRNAGPQCLEDCVHAAIQPFVVAAGEEGFRQALGGHNTATTCMESMACMNTVQTLVEEITHAVFKDRLQGGKGGNFAHSHGHGFTGSHCDSDCLVRTVQTAAGQAGFIAMAIGQKHFFGNDSFWNRWSPHQMLELDRAIRQLKGRNLAGRAFIYEANAANETDGRLKVDTTRHVRKFDLPAFRYNGTAEVPLLHHATITRAMARKILSYIPGWEVQVDDPTHDTERGNVDVVAKDFFLATDYTSYDGAAKLDPELQDLIQLAYTKIRDQPASGGPEGLAYFLCKQRLDQVDTVANFTKLAKEPWDRMLSMINKEIRISTPSHESAEDVVQLGTWVWQFHAYGVNNISLPVTNFQSEGDNLLDPAALGYTHRANDKHGERLLQWVTDSEAEPLKGVEGGYTHQPWTTPWFFEYPTNYIAPPMYGLRAGMAYNGEREFLKGTSGDEALAIRGYTFELQMRNKAFDHMDADYFRENAFDERTGAIKDFDMIGLWEWHDDKWPYVTAVTHDGCAFERKLSNVYTQTHDDKMAYDVLTAKGKPIYDERGQPIKLVYDNKTGLAETKYGRALMPLDKYMGDFRA